MELNQLLQILRRRWGVALFAFVVVLGIGVAAAYVPEEKFTATAALVAQPNGDAVDFGQVPLVEYLIPSLCQQVQSEEFRDGVEGGAPAELQGLEYDVSCSNEPGESILEVSVEGRDQQAVAPLADLYANRLVARSPVTDVVALSVIDPATEPSAPSAPAKTLILLAAVVLGLAAVVFVPLVANSLWKRLEGAEQIRTRFGTSVLGEVPKLRRRQRQKQVVQVLNDTDIPATTEAFHRLRTNVELALTGSEPRAIAVTSVHSGEGKSTVAATLAWALAAAGSKVTLIDADLRRPTIHELVGEPFGPGVAAGPNMRLADLVRPTREPNLRFVAAGTADRHPAEVVTVALPRMLDELERERRLVIVDSPPLRGVAETNLVAAIAGSAILVVDARRYDEQALEQAIYQLHEGGTRVLGVVINRARLSRAQRHMSHYYAARPYSPPDRARSPFETPEDERRAGSVSRPIGQTPQPSPPARQPETDVDLPVGPGWPRPVPGTPPRAPDESREVR